ncbi:MAG TPA: hypothetical protein VGN72_09615 [Tepidisphaeraceae bacterium]|jgi:hypothetical protein|nr:hypothetical protein [Tepidisphaeraceae bacterium]
MGAAFGFNGDGKATARVALLPHAPPVAAGAVVLADSNHDSALLHRDAAGQAGTSGECVAGAPYAPARVGLCGCDWNIAPNAGDDGNILGTGRFTVSSR